MNIHAIKGTILAAASALVLAGLAGPASATEGYFQPGYDALQQAVADAGVANPEGALTISGNPAGLTFVGTQFEGDLSLFSPLRGYTVSGGPGFVAPGSVQSGNTLFGLPALGYSHAIDAHSAWGVGVYGNGGMNTEYSVGVANPVCAYIPMAAPSGVFCGGKTGVNLDQVFFTVGYARKAGAWSFGVAPIFAVQMFSAYGLGAFEPYSVSPGDLTNNNANYSVGGGVRFGLIWSARPDLRLAVSGSTPIWMTRFNKYKGLFADGGSFDIPPSVTAGAAWDVSPSLTLMADYKHIFYSTVPSVGDSSSIPLPFGAPGGPGFGWSDVDAFAVGAEWRATRALTLRAGFAHNNDPISPADVTINILAPGVVTNHITGGLTYKMTPKSDFDLSVVYAPTASVTGIEVTPQGPNPGRDITLSMHQWDVTAGYRFHF